MAGLLPPVVATLIADTKEYSAKMTEAQAKMGEFGVASETTGGKMTAFGKKATTAVAAFTSIFTGADACLTSLLCSFAMLGAITRATIDISLMRIFIEGPDVSLNGSPTVSPVTDALCGSDFL